MLKFKVIGVRRETGTDIGLVVDATDEIEAIEKARKLGVLAERCELQRRPAESPGIVRVIEMTCAACGKAVRIKEGRADEAGKCKCGAVLATSAKAPAAAATSDRKRTSTSSSLPDHIAPPIPTKLPSGSTRSSVHRELEPRSPRLALLLTLTGIVLAAGIAAAWHFTVGGDRWEADHRAQIIGMRDEARSLARQGKLADSAARYSELLSVVAGRPLQDSEVSRSVINAESERIDVTARIAANAQQDRDSLAAAEQARVRQQAQVADAARAHQQTEDANVRTLLERWATTQENAAAVEARMRSLRSLARSYSEAGDPEASLKAANELNDADPRLSELNGKLDTIGLQIGQLDPILVLVTARAMAIDSHQTNERRPIYAQLAATLSQNVAEADVEQWRAMRAAAIFVK